MPELTKKEITKEILQIEERLRFLRLALTENEEKERKKSDKIKVGDWVEILNPTRRLNQESVGRIIRVGSFTGKVTVESKEQKEKIVRDKKNVRKIENPN